MTTKQFGQKIKAKYPQYNDLSDEELGQKMLAKYPQYQDMITSGLDEEQIRKQIEAGKKAEQFLNLPWYKQIFTTQFAREVPGAAVKVLTETPARVVRSFLEAGETIGRFGGEPTITRKLTSKIPLIKDVATYFEPAKQRAEEIVGGEPWVNPLTGKEEPRPLWTALTPFVQVPLEVWQTAETGKQLVKGVQKIYQVASNKILQREFNTALNTVMEEPLTKAEKIEAFQKGEVTKTKLGTFVKEPSGRDIEVASSSVGIVEGKDPVADITNLQDNVATVSEKSVRPFLQKNSYYLGKKALTEVEQNLRNMEEPTLIYSEGTLEGAKDKVVDTFMKIIKKNQPEDTAELWDSLKEIDDTFQSQFGNKALYNSERFNAVKSLYLEGRRIVQDYIVGNTPAATNEFKYYIDLIHDWKTAEAVIATKNAAKLGASWFKLHPQLIKGLEIAGGSIAGGGIVTGLINFLKKK